MYNEIRRRPRHRIVAIMAGALLAAVGLPAVAQAACPITPTTKAFQRFGDTADYSLLSNGHFESGTSGWTLTGAAVVTGNESFKVRASTDARVADDPADGEGRLAEVLRRDRAPDVPAVCAPGERQLGDDGRQAALDAEQRPGQRDDGRLAERWELRRLAADGPRCRWRRRSRCGRPASRSQVQVVFDPEDFGGAWAIDDVYIDPYRR